MTMDCQPARSRLDASRPHQQDWDEPELRGAADHVRQCHECQRILSRRDAFDQRVASAMRQIDLPDGLRLRLDAALAGTAQANHTTAPGSAIPAAAEPAATAPAQALPQRQWRRRLVVWVAPVAACLMLALGTMWWLGNPAAGEMSITEVYHVLEERYPAGAAPLSASDLPPFDGDFTPAVTSVVWQEVIDPATGPRGIDLDGKPGHEAAVYAFQAGHGRIRGLLLVLPRSSVREPPESRVPDFANAGYLPRPHVVWSSDEHVFLCVLDQGSLDDLRATMYGGRA